MSDRVLGDASWESLKEKKRTEMKEMTVENVQQSSDRRHDSTNPRSSKYNELKLTPRHKTNAKTMS